MSDLTQIIPPHDLSEEDRSAVFQHILRSLAAHRYTAELYAMNEYMTSPSPQDEKKAKKAEFEKEVNEWAQHLLRFVWTACGEPGGGDPPTLDPYADTSTVGLPPLPSRQHINQLFNTVLFLHVTSDKVYSSRTRDFLYSMASPDEAAIAATLKDPTRAIEEAERKTNSAKDAAAARSATFRKVGIGLGAVAGGVLIGVTGGLAAPLVGASVTTVLGWLGVGGTAAGILASGLAGSSVVCGALFGVYGSKKSAEVVERYTKEVEDLAILPARPSKETLAVRLCISGWLDSQEDVVGPWTVFDGDDTFALQWEVRALEDLSNALTALIKAQVMKHLKAEIIKRTVFASLFAALSPTSWLKIAQIIDNPWMRAKALAVKTGQVLGMLLHQRVLGNRPITLVGYSLGSLVIFEALQYLASLPPAETAHLLQDVFLFGAPVRIEERTWAAARRVVAGRLVNGYGSNDYILAVLSRVSDVSWGVAGLDVVPVKGVENVACDQVDGHLKWRGMIGQCLQKCGAPDLVDLEVKKQLQRKAKSIAEEMDMDEEEVNETSEQGVTNESDMP